MRDRTQSVLLPDLEHHGWQIGSRQLNCHVARVYPRPDAAGPTEPRTADELLLSRARMVERVLDTTVILVSVGTPLIAAGMTLQALM